MIELTADESGPAGSYTLSVPFADAGAARPDPDDVALVLHTSGTTSRPKIVPLRQRNLAASARNIAATLALTPQDRCLVIMPLFHIHGLIGALLSSLHAGASVHCPPGFNALKFFAWLDQAEATWYTAVPTMHQTILARADRNADVIARRKLRLIRSSSASLPPQVMKRAGGDLRLPGDRILRHDRGLASDGEQPAAAAPAQARHASASPPGRRSRSWISTASCSIAARSARS